MNPVDSYHNSTIPQIDSTTKQNDQDYTHINQEFSQINQQFQNLNLQYQDSPYEYGQDDSNQTTEPAYTGYVPPNLYDSQAQPDTFGQHPNDPSAGHSTAYGATQQNIYQPQSYDGYGAQSYSNSEVNFNNIL